MKKISIALIAHDAKKDVLVEWVGKYPDIFHKAALFATGTTGGRLLAAYPDLDLTRLKSGPLGGDQQIGAMIAEGKLDAMIFFVDPLSPMPHDVDVKALTRLAIVYDLPMACNIGTAEAIMHNDFFR
ncbi:MAG TPA: methylglyoxal synthase [Sphingomonadales bacterium]|nr:methylglyoxal synthase [Sphingomonadales bacterium]